MVCTLPGAFSFKWIEQTGKDTANTSSSASSVSASSATSAAAAAADEDAEDEGGKTMTEEQRLNSELLGLLELLSNALEAIDVPASIAHAVTESTATGAGGAASGEGSASGATNTTGAGAATNNAASPAAGDSANDAVRKDGASVVGRVTKAATRGFLSKRRMRLTTACRQHHRDPAAPGGSLMSSFYAEVAAGESGGGLAAGGGAAGAGALEGEDERKTTAAGGGVGEGGGDGVGDGGGSKNSIGDDGNSAGDGTRPMGAAGAPPVDDGLDGDSSDDDDDDDEDSDSGDGEGGERKGDGGGVGRRRGRKKKGGAYLDAASLAVHPLRNALAHVDTLANQIIEPFSAAAAAALEQVVDAMHRESFGSRATGGMGGMGGDGMMHEGPLCSRYMKQLTGAVRRVSDVLQDLPMTHVVGEFRWRLGARVMSIFVRHASLIRPMEEAGRVKLAQDLVQLEIASAPLGAPASWGFIYDVRL